MKPTMKKFAQKFLGISNRKRTRREAIGQAIATTAEESHSTATIATTRTSTSKDNPPIDVDTMRVVKKLESNQLSRWSLTKPINEHSESWDRILTAMDGNTSLHDLYIGAGFYTNLSAQEFDDFLMTVGQKLKGLRVLSVGALEFAKSSVTGTSIGAFLTATQHLHTLRIERKVDLQSMDEVYNLAKGFQDHPSLKRVSLPNLHPNWKGDDENEPEEMSSIDTMLDPLLKSLASISALQSLQIGLSNESFSMDMPVCSVSAVGSLGTLPHLTWLVLHRMHIEDVHVEQLCHQMQRTNSPIKILDVTKAGNVTERAWRAILHLVQTQVFLEAVDMHCHPDAQKVKEKALLFLKLNREGRRRHMRESADQGEWTGMVSKYFQNDVSAIHILLRDNPSMCLQR